MVSSIENRCFFLDTFFAKIKIFYFSKKNSCIYFSLQLNEITQVESVFFRSCPLRYRRGLWVGILVEIRMPTHRPLRERIGHHESIKTLNNLINFFTDCVSLL